MAEQVVNNPQAGAAPQNQQPAAPAQQPAAQPQQPVAQPQQPAEKICPKDCSKCTLGHQVYCTAKMTFDSFSVMSHIISLLEAQAAKIDAQSKKISELSEHIASIGNGKTEFSAPAPIQGDLFKNNK